MPQVNLMIGRRLDDGEKDGLQLAIGSAMGVLPGKTMDNTVICLADGVAMFRGGKPNVGAFVDVRLYKASPEDAKGEFAKAVFGILNDKLGIDPAKVYMNFTEMPNWAANGSYF